jgi:hypothetical protein
MPPTRDEAREMLLGRISPHWSCPACDHEKFFVPDAFMELLTRGSLNDKESNGSVPCLGLVCMSCGYTSLHAVSVFDGSFAEQLGEAEEG